METDSTNLQDIESLLKQIRKYTVAPSASSSKGDVAAAGSEAGPAHRAPSNPPAEYQTGSATAETYQGGAPGLRSLARPESAGNLDSRDFEARRYKQQSQVKQLGDFLEQISSVRNRAQPTSPGAPGEPPTNNLQSGAGLAGDSGVARPGGSSKLQHYQEQLGRLDAEISRLQARHALDGQGLPGHRSPAPTTDETILRAEEALRGSSALRPFPHAATPPSAAPGAARASPSVDELRARHNRWRSAADLPPAPDVSEPQQRLSRAPSPLPPAFQRSPAAPPPAYCAPFTPPAPSAYGAPPLSGPAGRAASPGGQPGLALPNEAPPPHADASPPAPPAEKEALLRTKEALLRTILAGATASSLRSHLLSMVDDGTIRTVAELHAYQQQAQQPGPSRSALLQAPRASGAARGAHSRPALRSLRASRAGGPSPAGGPFAGGGHAVVPLAPDQMQQMQHQMPPMQQMQHQMPPMQQMQHQTPPMQQMQHQMPSPGPISARPVHAPMAHVGARRDPRAPALSTFASPAQNRFPFQAASAAGAGQMASPGGGRRQPVAPVRAAPPYSENGSKGGAGARWFGSAPPPQEPAGAPRARPAVAPPQQPNAVAGRGGSAPHARAPSAFAQAAFLSAGVSAAPAVPPQSSLGGRSASAAGAAARHDLLARQGLSSEPPRRAPAARGAPARSAGAGRAAEGSLTGRAAGRDVQALLGEGWEAGEAL